MQNALPMCHTHISLEFHESCRFRNEFTAELFSDAEAAAGKGSTRRQSQTRTTAQPPCTLARLMKVDLPLKTWKESQDKMEAVQARVHIWGRDVSDFELMLRHRMAVQQMAQVRITAVLKWPKTTPLLAFLAARPLTSALGRLFIIINGMPYLCSQVTIA